MPVRKAHHATAQHGIMGQQSAVRWHSTPEIVYVPKIAWCNYHYYLFNETLFVFLLYCLCTKFNAGYTENHAFLQLFVAILLFCSNIFTNTPPRQPMKHIAHKCHTHFIKKL